MTREEIISGLKFTVDMFLFDPFTGESITEPRNDMDKTTIDACIGAIELLEQKPCEDCVSRQAVLDTLDAADNFLDEDRTVERYKTVLTESYKVLPSVNPQEPKQGHWIPVSERLPEKNVEVLVTTEWDCITIAEMFSNNDWFIYDGATTTDIDDIKAWMLLPEPYRAESEEKKNEE